MNAFLGDSEQTIVGKWLQFDICRDVCKKAKKRKKYPAIIILIKTDISPLIYADYAINIDIHFEKIEDGIIYTDVISEY